jgi:hypothetical protein
VVLIAKKDRRSAGASGGGERRGFLRVTADAQIAIAHVEQFWIDGAVRVVTRRAAFAQRRMLKDEWLRLFAMALRAGVVQTSKRKSVVLLHDVPAMRVVALHAIHFAFGERMMLRQVK